MGISDKQRMEIMIANRIELRRQTDDYTKEIKVLRSKISRNNKRSHPDKSALVTKRELSELRHRVANEMYVRQMGFVYIANFLDLSLDHTRKLIDRKVTKG